MSGPSPTVTGTRLRCTSGRTDRPIQRTAQPSRAPRRPTGTAQSRVARVGSTPGGTVVSASEKVPRPVQLSRPRKTRAPMPEASRPGQRDEAEGRPGDAGRLHDEERAEQGRAEQGADRGEAAGRRHDRQRHRRGVLLDQAHGERREAAADGDERRLGAEHRTQAQGRERGQDDAGQVAVDRRAHRRSGSRGPASAHRARAGTGW